MDKLVKADGKVSANDAILYGVINWCFYNDDIQKTKERLIDLLKKKVGIPLDRLLQKLMHYR